MRTLGEKILDRAPRILDAQRSALQAALEARKDAAVAVIAKVAAAAAARAEEAGVEATLESATAAITAAAEKLLARIARAALVAEKAQSHMVRGGGGVEGFCICIVGAGRE